MKRRIVTWIATIKPSSKIMKKVTLLFLLASTPVAFGQNLLTNGDFEMGNVGFSSDYTYNPSSIDGEGRYAVVSNARSVHPAAAAFGDHTTGTGKMLALNGAVSPGVVFWRQSISVVPGTSYRFSGYVRSWFPDNPANLRVSINGISLGTARASVDTGIWIGFSFSWFSSDATQANIQIQSDSSGQDGNDFAVDDLSFIRDSLATVKVNEPGEWRLFTAGEFVASPTTGTGPATYWRLIPDILRIIPLEHYYLVADTTKSNAVQYGKLDFTIQTAGAFWMLTTTRFGGGGNSSGNWQPELSTQAQLEANGWRVLMNGDVQSETRYASAGQNTSLQAWVQPFRKVDQISDQSGI